MTGNLNLVYKAASQDDHDPTREQAVSVDISLKNETLFVRFDVTNEDPYTNPLITQEESQWGLWDWDVVEVFIALQDRESKKFPAYYEFQISPLNQFFELEIFEPRKKWNQAFKSSFKHAVPQSSENPSHKWSGQMEIPLRPLGWDPKETVVVGNAFAVLGEKNRRGYWSLFLPPQAKPDFHLPEFFKPLV